MPLILEAERNLERAIESSFESVQGFSIDVEDTARILWKAIRFAYRVREEFNAMRLVERVEELEAKVASLEAALTGRGLNDGRSERL